jgi:hypothetical protein
MNESIPQQPPVHKAEELELQEYQAITPEQEEAMQRIAEIDNNLRQLDIIINSIDQTSYTVEGIESDVRDGKRVPRPNLYEEANNIKMTEDALEEAYLAGSVTAEQEDELNDARTLHGENQDFYGKEKDRMFKFKSSESEYRVMGREEFSEEIEALFLALEGLGVSREDFVNEMNEYRYRGSGYTETEVAQRFLGSFRSKLVLQRNTERLAIPNEILKMSAELTISVGADKVDYNELLYPHGEHRGQFAQEQVSVNQIFETLPFKEGKTFAEYPTEVQERFFTSTAKKVFTAAGKETAYDFDRQASSLGKDLSELRLYGTEQFRRAEDINFDIEKTEKILEYAKSEEEYLRTCLKADKKFTLDEKGLNDLGWRYDPDRPEESEEHGLTWPVPEYEVRAEEDRIKYAGNTSGRSYAHTGGWRRAMVETLATLKAENPYKSRGIDPLDIIIALRKTKDRIQVELETIQLEKEQLQMHTKYLQDLKGKQISLAK